MKVRLMVASGTAPDEVVHETEIPPFSSAPEVIGWGDRVFKLTAQLDAAGSIWGTSVSVPDSTFVYHEVFAYAIVT